MQLGLENKKKTMWAAILGVVALLVFAYELIPLFTGSSTPNSSAQAAAPSLIHTPPPRPAGRAAVKLGKKAQVESLDPTLRLDLLANSEKTQYEGNGRNIFVSQAEDVKIETPKGTGATDRTTNTTQDAYRLPTVPPAPPIPLKFYGFASSPGEPKRVFLKMGEDVFVAGEGEIVNRRYKVMRISNNSVEIQDMVYSGPPQNIPLTQG
ncbi:MAG TPA: hypothetical protein VGS27_28640 [Candidatus Sulfotelmatobacter sp.]|nr:hypothetical protein [Candidatus Sulfotelmatobacter sp.]